MEVQRAQFIIRDGHADSGVMLSPNCGECIACIITNLAGQEPAATMMWAEEGTGSHERQHTSAAR